MVGIDEDTIDTSTNAKHFLRARKDVILLNQIEVKN